MKRHEEGDLLEVAGVHGRIGGVYTLKNGDSLVYLGRRSARVSSRPSKDWLENLVVEIMWFHDAVSRHGVPDYLEVSIADNRSFSIRAVKDGCWQHPRLVGSPGCPTQIKED